MAPVPTPANAIFEDRRLCIAAKGLLVYLLSRPPNWTVQHNQLQYTHRIGRKLLTKLDGVFEYFGEGQTGDMSLQKGNKAIATHSAEGKSLLLFRKSREGLVFEDEMVYETHRVERAPDSKGMKRDAIVFELRPLSAVVETIEAAEGPGPTTALDELRRRAYAAAGIFPASRVAGFRNVYQRSEDVRVYVLGRAKGNCEGCETAAPFVRKNGSPYLEPHHIRRVSDGGPDDPAFVIALCPNCHRRVHAGRDGTSYNAKLLTSMLTIEPKFGCTSG